MGTKRKREIVRAPIFCLLPHCSGVSHKVGFVAIIISVIKIFVQFIFALKWKGSVFERTRGGGCEQYKQNQIQWCSIHLGNFTQPIFMRKGDKTWCRIAGLRGLQRFGYIVIH
jgi:hypothetical protein